MFSAVTTLYYTHTEKRGPDGPNPFSTAHNTRKKLIFLAAIILDVIVGILIAQFLTPYNDKWWVGAVCEFAITILIIGLLISADAPAADRCPKCDYNLKEKLVITI